MKKTCFILSLAGVAALAACSTQELESPANLQNGMLMVRPIMPEVEIETKAPSFRRNLMPGQSIPCCRK